MKKQVLLITLCLFFSMVTNALSADVIKISYPFAFKDRFQPGVKHLGFTEGDVLQLGCFIKSTASPIKEVTFKNLDTGLVLTATSGNIEATMAGMYVVLPLPPFKPDKHMGVWEVRVKDEEGNEAKDKTHKLDIKGTMPYLKGLKASGNPLAPMITWTAPNKKDIPKGVRVRYRVRLLRSATDRLYRSDYTNEPRFQVPEGEIKAEDLSKVYVRVECYGYDKNDKVHPMTLELSSQTFMPLKKALGKQ